MIGKSSFKIACHTNINIISFYTSYDIYIIHFCAVTNLPAGRQVSPPGQYTVSYYKNDFISIFDFYIFLLEFILWNFITTRYFG